MVSMFLVCVGLLVTLVGCQKTSSNSTTTTNETTVEASEEFVFLEENVGKSVEELTAILNDELTPVAESSNVYLDSNGVQYSFQNDKLVIMKYTYQDVEEGFNTVRRVYESINASVGDERLDNITENEKTFKDVLTLDDLRALPASSDGAYVCSSNWFYEKEGVNWEPSNPDNEIVMKVWEANQKRPMLVLDVRLYDSELWMSIGFNAVPVE